MNPHAQSKDPLRSARADGTLLSDAFDLDLDFDLARRKHGLLQSRAKSTENREGHEFHSCRMSAPKGIAASAPEVSFSLAYPSPLSS
jgi:hypothetical protein